MRSSGKGASVAATLARTSAAHAGAVMMAGHEDAELQLQVKFAKLGCCWKKGFSLFFLVS